MRYIRAAAVLAALSFVSACAWKRTPVPVISDTGSTALLVGTWSGEYNSRETGRSGSITFDMASEKDTAYCDVVMVPKVAQTFNVATHDRAASSVVQPPSFSQPLRIRFIRLGERRVSGTLDPYTDPDCDCRVTTTFDGRITSANTIEGTYITTGAGARISGGTWKVNRQKATATTN
jgi:hypothetical protein